MHGVTMARGQSSRPRWLDLVKPDSSNGHAEGPRSLDAPAATVPVHAGETLAPGEDARVTASAIAYVAARERLRHRNGEPADDAERCRAAYLRLRAAVLKQQPSVETQPRLLRVTAQEIDRLLRRHFPEHRWTTDQTQCALLAVNYALAEDREASARLIEAEPEFHRPMPWWSRVRTWVSPATSLRAAVRATKRILALRIRARQELGMPNQGSSASQRFRTSGEYKRETGFRHTL